MQYQLSVDLPNLKNVLTYSCFYQINKFFFFFLTLFSTEKSCFFRFSLSKFQKNKPNLLSKRKLLTKKAEKTQKNQQAGFSAERCLCVRARERHMHHLDSRFSELRSPQLGKNAASRSISNTNEILCLIFRFLCAFSARKTPHTDCRYCIFVPKTLTNLWKSYNDRKI